MNKNVQFQRLAVLRWGNGKPDKQITVKQGIMAFSVPFWKPRPTQWISATAPKPIAEPDDFYLVTYAWDGQETTVSGLPVYR